MLKKRAQTIATFVFLTDLALISLAFLAAHWLRNETLFAVGLFPGTTYPLQRYLPLLPLALLVWGIPLFASSLYRSHRRVPIGREIWDLVKINLIAGATFTLALYFFRLDQRLLVVDYLSRAWIGLFIVLSLVFLVAEKVILRSIAHYIRGRGFNYRSVLFVGTSDTTRLLLDSFDRHRYWGYKIVGIVLLGDSSKHHTFEGYRVFSNEDLVPLCDKYAVDEVIVAEPLVGKAEWEEALLALNERGIAIGFAVNPLPAGHGRLTIGELDGIPLLSLSRTPNNPWVLLVKRAVDIAISAAAITLLSPLFVLVGVMIKSASPGPIFFRQTRVGLNGRPFKIVKFRTMVEGAEKEREKLEHLNEVDGPVFKVRNDPRLIRCGSFLRKFSLDELPQLWNVLTGEMSLVGPRPPTPDEVAKYEPWQLRRLSMRPGITCLWQVSGRSTLDFNQWMKLDLDYIDNWSPWLDLKILLRTLPAVFSGRGAY